MIRKELMKEIDADLRNKLTLPRVILGCILADDKSVKAEHVEKAISSLDRIPHLIEEWFAFTDQEYEVMKALIEGELSSISKSAGISNNDPIIQKYKDTLSNIGKKFSLFPQHAISKK